LKARWIFALLLLLAWIGGIGWRLYQLQVRDHEEYQELAKRQQLRRITLEPHRGTIYDARGRKLALSLEVDSAWACPRDVEDPATASIELSGVLGLDRQKLEEKLTKDKEFVWIARQLDSPVSAAVRDLDLAGVTFLKESKRYYPMRELASQVVGFASVDHKGLEGLEGLYDQVVTGEPVNRRVLRDARFGTASSPTLSFGDAEPGRDLYLTIDVAIQHIVERELARAVEQSQARGGTAVVLDPRSGAVLAMASLPSFDPNRFRHFEASQRRNRVVADAFEPGSTFKMVTAAAALEANLIDPTDILDCERGGITLHGIRINDHHPFDLLTFREVIAKSSNIGAIKTGLMVGRDLFYQQIRSFGFGEPTGIDLPGEATGLVRPADRWARLATAYIAFGQGISVTSIQLASAFAAVANGGQLLEPYVVRGVGRGDDVELVHPRPTLRGMPITPTTARTLERLLEAVVTEGTGKKAAIEGYRVAGKTGTAQKAEPGKGYSPSKFVASFVGFAPARNPAVVTLIVIDEPKEAYHGGDVAAPVFSAIVREVLLYLQVPPQREPLERWPGELLADIDGQDPGSPATAALDLDRPIGEVRERGGAELASGPVP
jgi:cell division protein FtsI (penicillin-binding protein 3)